MTEINKHKDNEYIDKNLDRLLELGELIPKMPENVKHRIRTRLIQVAPDSGKNRIFSFRWVVLPLAAAAVLIFFMIFPWLGNVSGSITWADVHERLNQVHTLTFSAFAEISEPTGMRITKRNKIYYKDPGFSRIETYPQDAVPLSVEEEPQRITITTNKPGSSKGVTLHPGVHRAELLDSIYFTDGQKPLSPSPMDLASFNWELMKEITAGKTRDVGDRIINGINAVGFEFDVPTRWYIDADGKVRAQLWASHDDGNVLLIELKYRNIQGQNVRAEYSDFRWNVPIDDSLFDLTVPEGWSLSRTRTELAEFTNVGLAPGVTLQIGPDGQEPLTKTEEVVRVVRGEQITHPGSDIPCDVKITIELKPEAIQRLIDYAHANPKELIIVDFNGQIKVVPNLYRAGLSQLNFDLSLLDLPLAKLEARYFSTTIERNGI